jgi:hypothetical protein
VSYSFRVVKADGKLTVHPDDERYVHLVPDGTFSIGGHSDNGSNESISVSRTAADGNMAAQASGWHK